ncbi:ABC transporter substrate-binding protein [Pseudomonas eucalypticola]|uniref:ABC transporter substrate-binding protein n=1 Tax=Pseudomonas eucalypticola TaxID=2599595 RepID=A0A7D5H756_9PSED|nr:ABC transporter substrate-binding protein [Pseudomonas eucalypticola]QKZ04804.1 ABC transporter substrate-binding protein [Pseudomonas eucalypticola]
MSHFSRRRVLQAGLALGAGCLAGRAMATGPGLRVWRYKGLVPSFLDLAGQGNLPYPVQWADIAGGSIVIEALASDHLDYAYMSEIPPVFAAAANAPIKLIAVVRGDANETRLVVNKAAGIQHIRDLRGKRVSFVRGTNTQAFLLNLLQRNGLALTDVVPVPMPMQDALIAFQNGHIDALVAGGISGLRAATMMDGEMLEGTAGYYAGNYLIATNDAALADPVRRARIGDFLQRERATWAWIQAHPDAWADRSAQLTGISRELYLQQFHQRSQPAEVVAVDDTAIASQQHVADLFHDQQLIRRAVDVRPLWRHDFNQLLSR